MSNIVRIDDEKGRPRYYDFGTKNESFMLTAKELKELGIKNWYFMLEVKYPNLKVQDLDCRVKDITQDQEGAILIECKNNPWYFFREVIRIPVRGYGELPLELHRAGCAVIWCWMNSFDFEIVQPRQTYKTTVLTAIVAYSMLFEYRYCDIPYMHTSERRCTENVGILRDYIMALPSFMNPWSKMKHPPGLQSLRYDAHNVSIAVISAAKTEAAATDKARGYSLYMWFADECEFIPHMKAVIDGANPTIVQARRTAREKGIRASMMYASTPGNLETESGKEWQKIIDNLPAFNEKYYDLTFEEIERLKSLPGPNDTDRSRVPITMFYIEFNYIQLRKGEDYLKEQYYQALEKNTIGEYRRGVLLQRFRGGAGAFFRQEDLNYIQTIIREPDHDIYLLNRYHLYVYSHEIEAVDITSDTPYFDTQIPYLIGIDCATGKNGDNTAFCVVNPYTLQVVAEMLSPTMGALDLMRIVTILAKMIPHGLFCIESNMTGVDIIDFVQESQLENRFYHNPKASELTKNITEPNTEKSMQQRAKAKRYFGTYVVPKTRKIMFNLLRNIIHDYRDLVNTKYLVKDICNLVEQKNGNMAAASGEHDDICMAYLHAIYVLNYGYELQRFGIDKSKCIYDKSNEVMKKYDEEMHETVVDNTVGATGFEAQLLKDLTSQINSEYNNPGGYDDYGYRKSDYHASGDLQPSNNVVRSTAEDLSFFRDVNESLNSYDDFGMFGFFS